MNKRADLWRGRLIFTSLVLLALAVIVFVAIRLTPWFKNLSSNASFEPKNVFIEAPSGQQKIENKCYALLLETSFEYTTAPDCTMNAYARLRKYQYVNVSAYYGHFGEVELMKKWESRWLKIGAEKVSQNWIEVDGRKSLRVIEQYPQNQEKFVTIITPLDSGKRLDSKELVSALEIRMWYRSESDIQLAEAVLNSWRWRL